MTARQAVILSGHGLQPIHGNESHRVRHPRESGGPRRGKLDSRFRGNDVTFEGAKRRISSVAFCVRYGGSTAKILLPQLQDQNDSDGLAFTRAKRPRCPT